MLIEQLTGGFPSILKEGKIEFAPTYKRVKPENKKVNSIAPVAPVQEALTFGKVFDMASGRTPSWTDRIWFGGRDDRGVNRLSLMSYDCNNDVQLGDHRPVFAQFLFSFDTDGYDKVEANGHLTHSGSIVPQMTKSVT
jgi:hypothetical protein